jgi:hypothetical protein
MGCFCKGDLMSKYEYKINWSGNVTSDTIECENNEDAKRAVKKKLKEIGIPVGKYVFVDIVRLDDNKPIIAEELWQA